MSEPYKFKFVANTDSFAIAEVPSRDDTEEFAKFCKHMGISEHGWCSEINRDINKGGEAKFVLFIDCSIHRFFSELEETYEDAIEFARQLKEYKARKAGD